MSILRFPNKIRKKIGPRKHGVEQTFTMREHLNNFAKEVNRSAIYDSKKNVIYQSFKKEMNQAKGN